MNEPSTDPRVEARMNKADLIAGCVFLLLGLAIVYLSWTMPRLEARGVHPATVPGLVPGLLGLGLAFCGTILTLRSFRLGLAEGWRDFFAVFRSSEAGRFCIAAGLALGYTLVLVGLLPFWLATTVFVFTFILLFETWLSPEPKPFLRSAFWALVQGVLVGAAVTAVFQYGFLVRLP